MNPDRGVALISTLLVLGFLSVVGAAFLSTTQVETRISENYTTNVRLRYLAEGGIEEARERLRVSGESLTDALVRAGGDDLRLEASTNLEQLLRSDDRPIVPRDPSRRSTGEVDSWSFPAAPAARHVFLRNDLGDGPWELTDTNGIVTLVSIARIGDRRYRAEADVIRNVPRTVAALTLNGPPGTSGLGDAPSFRIDGTDRCGQQSLPSIGLVSDAAVASILGEIPPARQAAFPGAGPSPDVVNVSDALPGSMLTVSGAERLIERLGSLATDIYPAGQVPVRIGSVGSPSDPRVVRVEGDAVLGNGAGYGILLIRGSARVEEGFIWNGLLLVVGQGRLDWNDWGAVYGAAAVSRTREAPLENGTLGPPLVGPGEVLVDFTSASGGIYYDSCALADAFRFLPVSPIASRAY